MLKIALIGAGSFVFGPSVLYDAIVEHALPGLHLALVDKSKPMVDLMASVGKRMARDASSDVTITVHTEWDDALAKADFVICAAAVQLQARFLKDVEIIDRLSPGHLVTEFGGVAGISYSLRQIALITQLASAMKRLCPKAWLLCASNPLARVCEAASRSGIRTAGFCCNSMGAYGAIGRVWHGRKESFPWPKTREQYQATMAGVNHFTFITDLRDRRSGASLGGVLVDAVTREPSAVGARTAALATETGYYPANGDDHMRDFLVPDASSQPLEMSSHGNAEERDARIKLLTAVAAGTTPVSALLDHRAWERPIDFAAALSAGRATHFHSLNLKNDGQIPNLPRGAFVETPADVDATGVRPQAVELPPSVEKYNRPAAELNQLVVAAGLAGDEKLLKDAVKRDPTILDKKAGWKSLQECLRVNPA